MACWFESRFATTGQSVGLLSRNRAHWYFADLSACAAGHVVVPMFTTAPGETADYVMSFTDMKVLFVGETENWDQVRQVLPEGILLIALPGVELAEEHLRWEDLVAPFRGSMPAYQCQADDLVSLVFTSGTTGVPKGVMQTHSSNLIPIARFSSTFSMAVGAKFFSYLPLAHIAERQLIEGSSLVNCGEVHFNENLTTLLRDLPLCRPAFMFGPPRVWEQLQQGIIAQFGSQDAVDAALEADAEGVGKMIREKLGLDQAEYLLTAAAPTPPALIHWYDRFGICLMEGFGQTECMGPIVSRKEERRIGSIGKPTADVEVRVPMRTMSCWSKPQAAHRAITICRRKPLRPSSMDGCTQGTKYASMKMAFTTSPGESKITLRPFRVSLSPQHPSKISLPKTPTPSRYACWAEATQKQ